MEKFTALQRQLLTFHLFLHAREVQYKELTDVFHVSEKTIYRDIRLLSELGVIRAAWSRRTMSYLPLRGQELVGLPFAPPELPENEARRHHMERLLRLCAMMAELQMDEVTDPELWYAQRYPDLSRRTRERDFGELNAIGYRVCTLDAGELSPEDPCFPQTDEDWEKLDRGELPLYRRCRFPCALEEAPAFRFRGREDA